MLPADSAAQPPTFPQRSRHTGNSFRYRSETCKVKRSLQHPFSTPQGSDLHPPHGSTTMLWPRSLSPTALQAMIYAWFSTARARQRASHASMRVIDQAAGTRKTSTPLSLIARKISGKRRSDWRGQVLQSNTDCCIFAS